MKIKCQNCPRSTPESESGARVAGWVVWSGTTLGGEETTRIYCPACAGREAPRPPSWDAECRNCDARMSDDAPDDDEPVTEADAEDWKYEHQCEPDVWLITPDEVEKERKRAAELRLRSAAMAGT